VYIESKHVSDDIYSNCRFISGINHFSIIFSSLFDDPLLKKKKYNPPHLVYCYEASHIKNKKTHV